MAYYPKRITIDHVDSVPTLHYFMDDIRELLGRTKCGFLSTGFNLSFVVLHSAEELKVDKHMYLYKGHWHPLFKYRSFRIYPGLFDKKYKLQARINQLLDRKAGYGVVQEYNYCVFVATDKEIANIIRDTIVIKLIHEIESGWPE